MGKRPLPLVFAGILLGSQVALQSPALPISLAPEMTVSEYGNSSREDRGPRCEDVQGIMVGRYRGYSRIQFTASTNS